METFPLPFQLSSFTEHLKITMSPPPLLLLPLPHHEFFQLGEEERKKLKRKFANRISAEGSRKRQKEYVSDLEKLVVKLNGEKAELKTKYETQEKRVLELEAQLELHISFQ